MEYKTLESLVNRKIGYGIVQPGQSVSDGVPIIKVNNLIAGLHSKNELDVTTKENDEKYSRTRLEGGELIVSVVGTVGKTAIVPKKFQGCNLVRAVAMIDIRENWLAKWVKYYIDSPAGQAYIGQNLNTTVQATLNIKTLVDMPIPFLKENEMRKIVAILEAIDKKIECNQEINDNLEEQSKVIFDKLFPNISNGSYTVGNYITPKRGKNLLSKNAVQGNVPVVAGGLVPSVYHNTSNTKAPVLAISASGANAGYVSLWNIPIWASDSSYIDSSMTNNVYFWYVLLKKRQKEIFDAQTGSAQPHIYPQHIAGMPIKELEVAKIQEFNTMVTPIFEKIGKNQKENTQLETLRDILLPKLMSGEIDISAIQF